MNRRIPGNLRNDNSYIRRVCRRCVDEYLESRSRHPRLADVYYGSDKIAFSHGCHDLVLPGPPVSLVSSA